MLKKVSAFSKDPTPDMFITLCGMSLLDACTVARVCTVYVNNHQALTTYIFVFLHLCYLHLLLTEKPNIWHDDSFSIVFLQQ
ncbi:hypothetical protein KSP40_PGU011713 [Platanthera guangdongensis]|uniref:Uncharacterized protein n=1 Tax=Platanthera guangdongensis TaxID=2320717 RepID=A0ABR2LH71_9ASPA